MARGKAAMRGSKSCRRPPGSASDKDGGRQGNPRRPSRFVACSRLGARSRCGSKRCPAIVDIDSDERIARVVTFDVDDFDAAIAELDARYLAGEAAAYAPTWSVVAAAYAGFNRREPLARRPIG